MFIPRVMPCLLLKDKGLVKTKQFTNPVYVGDPINAVKIFNNFEAHELTFLDIDASKQKRTISVELVKKINEEAFMPFAVGGGINSVEKAKGLIHAGAEKIILNTSAFENPDLITDIADVIGSQSVVVSIDAKKVGNNYKMFICGGTKETNTDAIEFAKLAEGKGAGEILINFIDRDGLRQGYDLELIRKISSSVKIPVIAIGGADNLGDFEKAISAGASAVSAGSMFVFVGKKNAVLINYPDKDELSDIFKNLVINKKL